MARATTPHIISRGGQLYYVYTLAYPSTHGVHAGDIFYVGKGTKGRLFDHEKEAASGKNSRKCDVIREIWSKGGEVEKTIRYSTQNERDALIYEWALINMVYGPNMLTNRVRAETVTVAFIDQTFRFDAFAAMIQEYRALLSWSQAELARRAGLNNQTVGSAEHGERISGKTAQAICETLSEALGRRILAKDIDGLNVRR